MPHSQKITEAAEEPKQPFISRVLLRKSFAALKPCEQHRIVLLQANVQLEDQMRVLAILLGVGTAVGIAAGVSPRLLLAASSSRRRRISPRRREPVQAQASAAALVTAKGNPRRWRRGHWRFAGARRGDAPVRRSLGHDAKLTKRTSHTALFVSVSAARGSPFTAAARRVVGVRAAAGDDAVVIRRKRARTHVYSEPSMMVTRKKRYVHYREPSSTVVIKKRRPAVAVEGVSTRTTVRSNTSTTVRGAGATPGSVGASTSVRERSSGAGNAGTRSGGQGGQEPRPLRWRRTRPKIGNRYRRRGRQPLASAFWLARRDAPAREPDTWRIPEPVKRSGRTRTAMTGRPWDLRLLAAQAPVVPPNP